MDTARLTVVMPVYNAMPYLREAVSSILEQTFRDFVFVAIDDGSTDDSLAYLRSIDDPRLTVLQSAGRQGQGAARNRVMEVCTTEYLAFQDADDISLPTRFEAQVTYMDRHTDVGMLGSHFAFIGPSGRAGTCPPLALHHEEIRRNLLARQHAVANATLMFRTSVFAYTGVFRIAGAGEDWDLFLRMTEHTRVANLAETLIRYRLHPTSTNEQQAQMLMDRYSHACECALLRERAQPETSFEDFQLRQRQRPLWTRFLERTEILSGGHYRRAMVDLLEGSKVKGYARLAFAGSLSPRRVVHRLSRRLRKHAIS